MESTASRSIAAFLDPDSGTVGTRLDISHTAPSCIGMTVTCESELISVEGRKLVFSVRASDEAGEIGSGTHERYIIKNDKFMEKAAARKQHSQS
jgi:predicted thioesterase